MKCIELFAGGGGLALGLEKAGFEVLLLNDFNGIACKTLKFNRSTWNIMHAKIEDINFQLNQQYFNIDLITGGFPCQPFSHAGKRLGFEDTRGTLFYEFSRALKELQPTAFLAENVKGLVTHDEGYTLKVILEVLEELGYKVYHKVLNAEDYEVPQKRERLFIVGFKKDFINFKNSAYQFPPMVKKLVLKDVLKAGEYYYNDVTQSMGMQYSAEKIKYFSLLKPGENWKNLPIEKQKIYLGKMYESGGGKTGILKRLSWEEPSPTLLCHPSQKQTERCHPDEIRPLTVREYARIQTFPDNWIFLGSMAEQYKQIGNAVPVNLAYHVAQSVKNYLTG